MYFIIRITVNCCNANKHYSLHWYQVSFHCKNCGSRMPKVNPQIWYFPAVMTSLSILCINSMILDSIDHNFCLKITDCMDNNKQIIQSQTFVYLLLVRIFLWWLLLNYFDCKPYMARIDLKAAVFTDVYEILFCVEED